MVMLTAPRHINFGVLDSGHLEIREAFLQHTNGCCPSPAQVLMIRDRRPQKVPEAVMKDLYPLVLLNVETSLLKCELRVKKTRC